MNFRLNDYSRSNLDRISVEWAAQDGALLFVGLTSILAAPEQLP